MLEKLKIWISNYPLKFSALLILFSLGLLAFFWPGISFFVLLYLLVINFYFDKSTKGAIFVFLIIINYLLLTQTEQLFYFWGLILLIIIYLIYLISENLGHFLLAFTSFYLGEIYLFESTAQEFLIHPFFVFLILATLLYLNRQRFIPLLLIIKVILLGEFFWLINFLPLSSILIGSFILGFYYLLDKLDFLIKTE